MPNHLFNRYVCKLLKANIIPYWKMNTAIVR